MSIFRNMLVLFGVIAVVAACSEPELTVIETRVQLGEQLFNDPSLSKDGTQSCATCHDSNRAFIDSRINSTSATPDLPGAVSLGQDNSSLGDINTPSIMYAAYIPRFHFDEKEELFVGGLFFDGRANDLTDQAKEPFTDPVEMQMTVELLIERVETKYGEPMRRFYGEHIFEQPDEALYAIADAIAEFEKTDVFAPFDSKFDRVLKGDAQFTEQEQRGLELFKDEKKGNCAACHPVPELNSEQRDSLFTDFTYDNLGVPANLLVRSKNGLGHAYVDTGLFNNQYVDDPALKGAFRVSGLRNVAVTAPYMHNGTFKDLSTVVHFYNSRDVDGALNPETNKPWRKAEIDATKNTEELGDLGLSDQEVEDIVAFMKTLTDKRYEHLLD